MAGNNIQKLAEKFIETLSEKDFVELYQDYLTTVETF